MSILTMENLLFQTAIDMVSCKFGLPVREAAFGCKWNEVELLNLCGTITISTTSDLSNKHVINSVSDIDSFLATL